MENFEYTSEQISEAQDIALICGICGDTHNENDCKYVILTGKINDKIVSTRARLSLPDCLQIKKLADESNSVFAKSLVRIGTEFGPFVAKRNVTLHPFVTFPIKLFIENGSELSEYYLDTLDENECCWMMFVNSAMDAKEQNLICFQAGENIFFRSIRDIKPGDELKVWYSPYYANKMKKTVLQQEKFSNQKTGTEMTVPVDIDSIIKEQQNITPRLIWNCKFCYKLEKNVSDFAHHLSTHYTVPKGKTCPECQKHFRYRKDYRKHLKESHGDGCRQKESAEKYCQLSEKVEDAVSIEATEAACNPTNIGGPLLLQSLSDSIENSNSLIHQPHVNYVETENYDHQSTLVCNDTLQFSVDIIGNSNINDFDVERTDIRTRAADAVDFICDICFKKFGNVKAISSHLRMHMGKYFCSVCKKVFSRSENLKNHQCNKMYSYKCLKCSKLFYQRKYLSRHISVFHNKKHLCKACNKYYYSAPELENHVCDSVPMMERRKFTCTKCPKQFSKEAYLRQHFKKHDLSVQKPASRNYICSVCTDTFSTETIYKRHFLTLHARTHAYDCRICDKRFSRKDTLKSHTMNVHMRNYGEDFKCSKCGKNFKSKKYLDSHLKHTHDDSSKFRCHCGSTFKYAKNLKRHCNQFHTSNVNVESEETYQCPVCFTKIKLKRSLQRHLKTKHSDEYKTLWLELETKHKDKKQTHECPVCFVKLKSLTSLQNHTRKHHPATVSQNLHNPKELELKVVGNVDTTYHNCIDLLKTLENMDFNTESCSDSLFTESDTIDHFLKESTEHITLFVDDSGAFNMDAIGNQENEQDVLHEFLKNGS